MTAAAFMVTNRTAVRGEIFFSPIFSIDLTVQHYHLQLQSLKGDLLKTLSTQELRPDIFKALYEYEALNNQRGFSEEESESDKGFLGLLIRKIQSTRRNTR